MSWTVHAGELRFSAEDGQTLLEAAEAAGLSPANGCRRGHCLTCVARFVGGKVDIPTGTALSQDMLERRLVLPCVTRVRADCWVELSQGRPLFPELCRPWTE